MPDVHFELIPIRNLVSNQQYQRNLSLEHIKKAAENFDLCQINPVKVSRRDGVNYVFNGQHTIEIIATVSNSRETPVWCMVYDDLDYRTEAEIFANQQRFVKKLLPYEIFKANIEAGNDDQIIIKSLVESFGMKITPSSSDPNSICCVSTLEDVYRKYGLNVLERALRLCVGTWEGEENSLSANMVRAVSIIIVTYGDSVKDDVFKEKVGTHSVRELGRSAKERKGGSLGYAEAMVMAYNHKKTNSLLKISKLHSSRSKAMKISEKEVVAEVKPAESHPATDKEE